MNFKYLAANKEELEELEKAMELFSRYYVLEPKDKTIIVEKLEQNHLEIFPISPITPLETLYSVIIRSSTKKADMWIKSADFRDNAGFLELIIEGCQYDIHFGRKQSQ